jgi:uncharacterized protein YndB with AHSA1/START domain
MRPPSAPIARAERLLLCNPDCEEPAMSSQKPDRARTGTVRIDGQFATIVFVRILRHAPEVVWRAITDPAELKHWLMCTSATIDGTAGGRVAMVSGPAQFQVTGAILAWDPPRVYEHEWTVAPTPHMPAGENAIFRYELVPHGAHTQLTVTYRRLTALTARGFAPGTHLLLDRLEAQLDQGILPGWMPRFDELRSLYPAWGA